MKTDSMKTDNDRKINVKIQWRTMTVNDYEGYSKKMTG